ncbi:hypothetical protein FKP32DRAFT_916665 [Trametes sanguinea]|nr:hypothetical protein FKP32DRAFT_916665 [Trametes sanguinea]
MWYARALTWPHHRRTGPSRPAHLVATGVRGSNLPSASAMVMSLDTRQLMVSGCEAPCVSTTLLCMTNRDARRCRFGRRYDETDSLLVARPPRVCCERASLKVEHYVHVVQHSRHLSFKPSDISFVRILELLAPADVRLGNVVVERPYLPPCV